MQKSTEDKVSKESEISQELNEKDMERYETMSNARLEGESFEDYKQRRAITNRMIKQYLKGRRVK